MNKERGTTLTVFVSTLYHRYWYLLFWLSLASLVALSAASPQALVSGLLSVAVAAVLCLTIVVTRAKRLMLLHCLTLVGLALVLVSIPSLDALGRSPAWIHELPLPRVVPFPISENVLAYLTLPVVGGSLAFASNSCSGRARVAWVVVAGLALAAILATGARASIIASVVVTLTYVLPRRVKVLSLVAFLIAGALGATYLVGESDTTLRIRSQLWVEIVTRWPNGIGFGGFALRQTGSNALLFEAPGVPGGERPLNAHNTYLQTLLDFGWSGVILLAVATYASVREALYLRRETRPEAQAISAASLLSVASMAVAALAESVVSTSAQFGGLVITLISPVPFLVLAAPLGYRHGAGVSDEGHRDAHVEQRRSGVTKGRDERE